MNLVTFLNKNKNQIVEEWIDFAMVNIDHTGKMNQKEVKDHI